jgi:hypothetical protein
MEMHGQCSNLCSAALGQGRKWKDRQREHRLVGSTVQHSASLFSLWRVCPCAAASAPPSPFVPPLHVCRLLFLLSPLLCRSVTAAVDDSRPLLQPRALDSAMRRGKCACFRRPFVGAARVRCRLFCCSPPPSCSLPPPDALRCAVAQAAPPPFLPSSFVSCRTLARVLCCFSFDQRLTILR